MLVLRSSPARSINATFRSGWFFAAILLAIWHAMLLHLEGRPVWLIPMWLTGGAMWYIFWQALAITFLPNQSQSKDILSDLYQALAKKTDDP